MFSLKNIRILLIISLLPLQATSASFRPCTSLVL